MNMLQSSRSDQLLAYGPWMPDLMKAVKNAHSQFRNPPKGPIGVYTYIIYIYLLFDSSTFFKHISRRQIQFTHTHTHTHTHTLGSTFKLHDYRWSVAIEAIIGRDISAFVVDNTYDRYTLLKIIESVMRGHRGQTPNIHTSKYSVSSHLYMI